MIDQKDQVGIKISDLMIPEPSRPSLGRFDFDPRLDLSKGFIDKTLQDLKDGGGRFTWQLLVNDAADFAILFPDRTSDLAGVFTSLRTEIEANRLKPGGLTLIKPLAMKQLFPDLYSEIAGYKSFQLTQYLPQIKQLVEKGSTGVQKLGEDLADLYVLWPDQAVSVAATQPQIKTLLEEEIERATVNDSVSTKAVFLAGVQRLYYGQDTVTLRPEVWEKMLDQMRKSAGGVGNGDLRFAYNMALISAPDVQMENGRLHFDFPPLTGTPGTQSPPVARKF